MIAVLLRLASRQSRWQRPRTLVGRSHAIALLWRMGLSPSVCVRWWRASVGIIARFQCWSLLLWCLPSSRCCSRPNSCKGRAAWYGWTSCLRSSIARWLPVLGDTEVTSVIRNVLLIWHGIAVGSVRSLAPVRSWCLVCEHWRLLFLLRIDFAKFHLFMRSMIFYFSRSCMIPAGHCR